ncbi:hypothetical protein [Marinobacter sp. C1S70]|uniref:hypothetical protein n=1 Tax=Marinobacter sp. C1S70 TaxID=1396859 RepID=UPI0012681488|nr:hypothetical protein [Marinobacter sp. C1S70]
MYYLEKNCSVCGDGILGFLRCSDGRTIVVMCEECSSVWLTPDEVEDKYPLYPEAPRFFLLPNSNVSISGGDSGWASLEEISSAGMGDYADEGRSYDL